MSNTEGVNNPASDSNGLRNTILYIYDISLALIEVDNSDRRVSSD
jgi:hypothetical protein